MKKKNLLNYIGEVKAFAGSPLNLDVKDGVGELTLYDFIDPFWGISADSVVKSLAGKNLTKLVVRINSPGGDVFEGLAIYNFLKSRTYPIETINDGSAASIASVILLAGSTVKSSARSMIMIHDPWMVTMGNASDLRSDADLLDKTAQELAQIYIAKSGMSDADIKSIMEAETWISSSEALAMGLIDEVIPDPASDQKTNAASSKKMKMKGPLPKPDDAEPDVVTNPSDEPSDKHDPSPESQSIENKSDVSRLKAKAMTDIAALS